MNSCRVSESTVCVDIRAVIEQDAVVGDYDRVVPEGKRVICSVGGFEALSGGFIDCCPSEMLVDSGAIASLVHERVLRRDALMNHYELIAVAWIACQGIRFRGMIDLPVTLGSVVKTLPFVVVNHLDVDAILGTDTLRAFRAMIDLEEKALILKESGEVVPLGDSRVEECYGTDIATTVKLAPGRQALVRANVKGQVDPGATVLIEGIAGGDDSLRVARTLCTVLDGQVVWNTSTEELVITKDSQSAVAAVVPETAFQGQQRESRKMTTGTQVVSAARPAVEGDDVGQKQKTLDAVPAFERLMENVLVDLKWRACLVYLDDCVVFSDDFPTHLVRVRQVLERFRAAGFKLKMKKCHWGRNQVAFLGHIVTPSGILPNPEKVKAVMNVVRPHDLNTVRAFLGLTSYFRRYIPGFATIAAPLERLKENGTVFRWNEDCEVAFNQLQRILVHPPILVYSDFSKRFKLYVYSSHLAVGAWLMQEVDGRDRAVAFASKMLVGSQKHWIDKTNGTTEIECWGVVWATRKFRCYLEHSEFDLFTDHQALTWIFSENTRTTNAKLARWAME
ncbi:LOW QUALITY PROTEIN: hypothetical protein PHMEG_00030500 [Phytophthora megakarya]|uniref:RNA-directed DNA polymerase n=1 Tax=Phytophthora megakarya TaxID=4795 RepID=A0A225V172_9STRA|nr:LOW QUALITY PROTEIN: hypothetical protein PHMEG_00030500 [Phytophthora megakarya]